MLGCSSNAFLGNVYVFKGNVTPDDMDADAASVEPYATAPVSVDNNSSEGFYDFAYLPPGEYTVAYTCDIDDPDVDEDTVRFSVTQFVSLLKPGSSDHVHFLDDKFN